MRNPLLFIKLGLALLLLTAAVAWLAAGHDLRSIAQGTVQWLQGVGPLTFFAAMVLLPALGAPMLFFTLAAGAVFAPRVGMPLVAAGALAAIVLNMSLSYVFARYALRPLANRLLARLGYQPPAATGGVTDLIILVRATPGVPFTLQNYALGVADVPFVRYLAVSSLVALPMHAAFLFLGEAMLQGRGAIILLCLLLSVAAVAALRLTWRIYRRRAGGTARSLAP